MSFMNFWIETLNFVFNKCTVSRTEYGVLVVVTEYMESETGTGTVRGRIYI